MPLGLFNTLVGAPESVQDSGLPLLVSSVHNKICPGDVGLLRYIMGRPAIVREAFTEAGNDPVEVMVNVVADAI